MSSPGSWELASWLNGAGKLLKLHLAVAGSTACAKTWGLGAGRITTEVEILATAFAGVAAEKALAFFCGLARVVCACFWHFGPEGPRSWRQVVTQIPSFWIRSEGARESVTKIALHTSRDGSGSGFAKGGGGGLPK